MNQITHVFVSGCYDVLHAGHLQFFKEAKALGTHLTVNFALPMCFSTINNAPVVSPTSTNKLFSKQEIIDEVCIGDDPDLGLNFKSNFLRTKPDILAVTEDDQYADIKRDLCESIGATYVVLPKTEPTFEPISTSSIIKQIRAPLKVPVRVDFAGGWLDVPKYALEGAYIVNCTITPFVSKSDWPYEKNQDSEAVPRGPFSMGKTASKVN